MKPKTIITATLLLFVAASVVYLVVKETGGRRAQNATRPETPSPQTGQEHGTPPPASSENATAIAEAAPPPASSSPASDTAAKSPATLPAVRGDADDPTVGKEYPQLASAALVHAKLAELPDGVLLRAEDTAITQKDIDAEVTKAPQELREQFRKNAFPLLEQMATRKILVLEARRHVSGASGDERALLQSYFGKLVEDAQVSDREIAEFYEKNREMVGDATLEQVKPQIRQHLLQQKKQEIVDRHIQTIGQRSAIAVSAGWVKQQAELAKDNPVDKARASGKPTFVNFGAKGCRPCDMMEPIRQAIKKKYAGKLNVVFVHVRNEQILAARYGVQAIPLLVFFDKNGKEVFRHTGFMPRDQLEKNLAEMGVR